MMKINGKNYQLCLLDTNALSHFLLSPKKWLERLQHKFDISKTIICYSIFTLSELWYKRELFEKYIDYFSIFPSAMLDGHESIFVKETMNYENGGTINPIVLTPFAIDEPSLSPKERLEHVLEKSSFITRTKYWKDNQEKILNGILELKKNYPPKTDSYSKKEIEDFCFITSTTQVALRNRTFADQLHDRGELFNFDLLASIKSTSYVVFYKFYPDNRKPEKSDVFDIIISSVLPYVDIFITERNLRHIIATIKQRHHFLENVNCYTMKQIMSN